MVMATFELVGTLKLQLAAGRFTKQEVVARVRQRLARGDLRLTVELALKLSDLPRLSG